MRCACFSGAKVKWLFRKCKKYSHHDSKYSHDDSIFFKNAFLFGILHKIFHAIMSKTDIRIKAEQYYIENISATNKEVAEIFKVTEKTIADWIKKNDWEEKRLNFHASPTIIKQKLQAETIRIMSGEPASFSADAIAKLMAALDRCESEASPIIVHRILKALDLFISQIDPDFAQQCTPYHKQFLQHRISNDI